MKVKDFDGYEHNWPPLGYSVNFDDIRPKSSLHLRCRDILRKLYPTERILEEVPLPNLNLFVDFYLPFRKIVVECQGEQHSKFIPHFHRTKIGFIKSKARDKQKKEWCSMNNIRIIELPFSESDEEWTERIQNA